MFSPTSTASYTVTGTSAAGCTNTAVQSVTVNPKPTVTASVSNSIICLGNSTTLTGGGASTYTWTSGVTNGTAFSPTTTTSYTVTGTSAAGCTNTAVQSVTVNPNPTVTASITNSVICLGNSTTLTGGGASTYTWTGGITNGIAFSPTTTTSYTVTGTSTNGCTNTAVQSVTVNPIPTTTATTTGIIGCYPSSVTLNSSLAGISYTWSPPTGGSVSPVNTQSTSASGAGGTYTLFVQSTLGCTYSTTTAVTQNTTAPTGVNAGSNQTLTCASPSVTLSGSVTTPTNSTLLWTGANVCGTATNSITSVCGAGIYTLTATNPLNGCKTTSTVQVSPSAGAPSLTINPVTNTITCTNTLVTISISSTVSPASYTWSGTGIVSGNGTGTITVNQGGTFNFTLTNTTNSCTTSNNQVVVQNTTIPAATASTTGTLTCATTSVSLNAGLAGMNYTWTAPAGGSFGSANSQTTTALGSAGTYTVKLVNPANGCSYTSTTSVTQNTIAPITVASTTGTLTCSTTTVALNSTLAGVNYTWAAPAGGSIASANTQSTSISGASGVYTLTVANPTTGCTYTTTTSVTQNTIVPTTTASTNGTLTCSTNTVTLNSTLAGVNYTWTTPAGGNVLSANTQSTIASGVSGTYTLTVSNPTTGCTYSTTTIVTQNTIAPTTSASSTGSLTCSATTVALNSTLAGVNYTWTAPAGGNVSSINTQSTIASGISGTYTLTIKDPANGCSFTTTTSVTQNTTAPSTSANTSGSLTCATTSVSLNSTLSGVNYTWTAPAGGSVSSVNTQSTTASGASGTYTLIIKDPINGCTLTTTTSVTQNTTAPVTVASTTGTLTCTTNTVALNSSLSGVNYTWTAPSGGSVSSANTQSTTASGASGIYTITIQDLVNGCVFSTTTSVTQSVVNPTTTASSSGSLTCTNLTVALNSTLSGMNYTWTAPAGGNVSSANTQSTIASGASGIYTLSVLNPTTGCTYTTTASVNQNTVVPSGVSAGSNQTLTCGSPSVTLTGNVSSPTNATALWTGANVCGTATNTITSVCGAGIYTITATNPLNGCISSATVLVSPSAGAPSVTINPVTNTITCSNTLVTVSISSTVSPATYNWSGTGIVSGNGTGTITVNQGGTFNFTLTNTTNSCTTSNNQVVVQNTTIPTTTASTTGTLTCLAPTVALNSSLAGMNYTWTPPSGGAVTSANTQSTSASGASGTYTLMIKDPVNACVFSTTTSVTQNTIAPSVTLSPLAFTTTCASPTVQLTASSTNSNVTYSWSSSSGSLNNNSISNPIASGSGTFSVVLTNTITGCQTTKTATLIPDISSPVAIISSSSETLTCTNPVKTATITVTPSTNITYNWSPNPASGVSSSIATFTTPGTYTCMIINTVNSCSTTAQITISSNTVIPVINITGSQTLTCTSPSVTISTTVTPGSSYLYNWSGSQISGQGTGSVLVNTPNNYSVTVTDAINGCTASATSNIIQNISIPAITITNTSTLTCLTPTAILTANGGGTYSWTGPGIVSGASTASPIVNAAGIYTVTVTFTNGCTTSTTTSVAQNTTTPTIAISNTQTITCLVNTLILNATGGGTYAWTGPGIVSGATTANPVINLGGTYSLAVTASNGCISYSTTTVIQNTPTPTITISNTQTLTCLITTLTLNATGGGSYSWSGPGIISGGTTANLTVNLPGIYNLTVTAANGCSSVSSSAVTQNTTMPTLSISSNTVINPGNETPLTISGSNTSYTWSPAEALSCTTCSNPIASPTVSTLYCATTTEGICSSTKCVNVDVEILCLSSSDYNTPNAFSPNGDGNNDEFCLQGWKGCLTGFYIAIFNRWGNKVFESTEADFCWDGKYLGELLDPAVFVFYIKAELIKGGNIEKKGNITLIK